MGFGVAWFSLASLLLPAALSPAVAATGLTFAAVLASRFLVGFGEGVAMPAMNNLVARNVPLSLKATALGNCYTGFHAGSRGGCRGWVAASGGKGLGSKFVHSMGVSGVGVTAWGGQCTPGESLWHHGE